jgi:hypothetical protein
MRQQTYFQIHWHPGIRFITSFQIRRLDTRSVAMSTATRQDRELISTSAQLLVDCWFEIASFTCVKLGTMRHWVTLVCIICLLEVTGEYNWSIVCDSLPLPHVYVVLTYLRSIYWWKLTRQMLVHWKKL